jgi:hypothetical protein
MYYKGEGRIAARAMHIGQVLNLIPDREAPWQPRVRWGLLAS